MGAGPTDAGAGDGEGERPGGWDEVDSREDEWRNEVVSEEGDAGRGGGVGVGILNEPGRARVVVSSLAWPRTG